ncbi:MAG: hypothetical protein WED15_00250 [Akkermansiaceae bacterium]
MAGINDFLKKSPKGGGVARATKAPDASNSIPKPHKKPAAIPHPTAHCTSTACHPSRRNGCPTAAPERARITRTRRSRNGKHTSTEIISDRLK